MELQWSRLNGYNKRIDKGRVADKKHERFDREPSVPSRVLSACPFGPQSRILQTCYRAYTSSKSSGRSSIIIAQAACHVVLKRK